ncbi:hypothetical protein MMC12_004716 [Toensbergia leucococca]|nr:hypothetical protein [Toensbergia leucococca]
MLFNVLLLACATLANAACSNKEYHPYHSSSTFSTSTSASSYLSATISPSTTSTEVESATGYSSSVSSSTTSLSSSVPVYSSSSSSSVAPSSTASSGGTTYKASFTEYGAGDTYGSGNCNTATSACGWYSSPGYNAAASQNLFGAGPGAGAGPACGTCWRLTASTDSSGNTLHGAASIVVKVNNLCPAAGNPLCAQTSLTDTNQYGANVNFDTCIDDGASAALFGSSGVALAIGTATEVSCTEWSGSANIA